jgi:hypothetical protein
MPYICKSCGNRESFIGTQETKQWLTEDVYLDGEGDIQDYGDSEVDDSEVVDGPFNVHCNRCNEEATWVETEEEAEEIEEEFLKEKRKKEKIRNWKRRLK